MAWRERRYSPWLLEHEERLTRNRDRAAQLVAVSGVLIALVEALLPWEPSLTPDIHPLLHIAAAAVLLPVLYFMLQSDYRRKLRAFTVAMADLGRRLFFLDPYLDAEEFAVQEHYQGALLLPTQRLIDEALRSAASQSLDKRVSYFYRVLPSTVCEEDRMGLLSLLHPRTALTWAAAIGLVWVALPGIGPQIGSSHGLSVLPVLLPLYLLAARANSRFAFELALYDWLRLG